MPEELWAAAVVAAQEHGLWAVSQALRVNYDYLKARLDRSGSERIAAATPGFVALDGRALLASPAAGERTVVEMWSADGSRAVVRLGAGETIDLTSLAQSLWRRHR